VIDLSPTAPGRYEGSFPIPIGGVGTYFVRVEERRDGAPVAAAEAGLAIAYPAEFRQVTADPRRMQLIARAGGGHVLEKPDAAFADDLPPVTTPVPLQRTLLWIAAILLPLEIALRRLRISPADLLEWLRHPRPVSLWETAGGEGTLQPAPWMPGLAPGRRTPPPPVVRPFYADTPLAGHVTPGLARDTSTGTLDDEDDDALAATLRWLAARRGNSRGDSG
jgi:hypothetical protein